MIHLAPGPTYPSARGSVYLPFIATAPANPVTAFYDLLLHDARQQRPRLEVCKVLEAGAAWKAQDIAENGYWSHRAFNGEWPNATAKRFGCNLPSEYGDGANYIESLTAGMADAQLAFDSLARSDHHKVHLFGEVEFYKVQYHCGVGFAQNPDAPFQYYWCIWICKCLD